MPRCNQQYSHGSRKERLLPWMDKGVRRIPDGVMPRQPDEQGVCVDGEAETTKCSSAGRAGDAYLYHVENVCGSLKCPPYISGRELTCTVCSHRG
ncbi:hypothetical protein DPMN_182970 [Dreissena polymorpha]|uniref:Uncharacterized protein n=1 Tax=Dreissena polymorpha TaxID=45954 RepID=A0A9D4I558_DREPO|nr:hypothetical protein DPMN_182970 [Dreissena polymorpha]